MSRDEDQDVDAVDAADIQQLTALARSITVEDQLLDEPPVDLWASIEAEAFADEPTPIRPAIPFRNRILIAASAAAVVVAAVITVGVISTRDSGGGDVVASADLDALAEGFLGSATLVEGDEGLELELDLGDLPPDDGFYELWLIKDLSTGQMQSLGPIEGGGTVAWPDGFDPADYAVVDISIEPRDGIPTHSGVSVLRGQLES